jgi:hypothetical protein
MGSAAAMQALKHFAGGASGNTHSGNSQNAFIGMAMSEASKVWLYSSEYFHVTRVQIADNV